jgi:uncharacterized protein YjiS (DUF1127 family)
MSVFNLLVSAGKMFSEWHRRDKAYAQLMALDDHSLADIGLHRSQIGSLIEGVKTPVFSTHSVLFPNGDRLPTRKEA